MSQKIWDAVDRYFAGALLTPDAVLDEARAAAEKAGLPDIAVAPNQGKFLHLIARATGAARILEVGSLGGYSTIWLARALPPAGRLVSLEIDPAHAEVARSNVANAGFAERVEIRVGKALDLLPKLAAEKLPPFDFAFIDADKGSNAAYFDWAVKLGRSGTTIVVDNVVRGGAVADEASRGGDVMGVRRLAEAITSDGRVSATAVQTVGEKGYDGFLIAVVN